MNSNAEDARYIARKFVKHNSANVRGIQLARGLSSYVPTTARLACVFKINAMLLMYIQYMYTFANKCYNVMNIFSFYEILSTTVLHFDFRNF